MSIEDDIAFLERVPTLTLIGREALRVIAISLEHYSVARGQALFREGDPADCAYVVHRGSFAITRADPALARRPGQAVQVGPTALLGEMALLTDTKRPATATALEDAEVMRIPRMVFLRTLEGYPDAARRLTRELSAQLGTTLAELDKVRQRLEAIDGEPRP
ncbi:cyclic nucleotide-binding domain-containing protein [Starkeya sp. 3C]|uniref:Cyclic nucleotide-binding domain-containing protein n=1 Tax=Ancylobacter moscoviensis TaxID=2597768 RepID=A0ABY3DW76_9HYPH|nr:cyclic nucleotide-binding domain-containing protein [Ancylobacter moscoviensis]TSJ64189.1 cyclic nucleotide-binding domain-containing protein [Ancylobacter moscoviensis]